LKYKESEMKKRMKKQQPLKQRTVRRKARVDDIWRSRSQEVSADLEIAPDGFIVVEQVAQHYVERVWFMGIELKSEAQRLRKLAVKKSGKQNVVLMHKQRAHEVKLGWVI
jgi:hypothetical protein